MRKPQYSSWGRLVPRLLVDCSETRSTNWGRLVPRLLVDSEHVACTGARSIKYVTRGVMYKP